MMNLSLEVCPNFNNAMWFHPISGPVLKPLKVTAVCWKSSTESSTGIWDIWGQGDGQCPHMKKVEKLPRPGSSKGITMILP
jgi:hypothetical protein